MVHLYLMPDWFTQYNILLHLFFGIITLLVSVFSFRIYKLSGQRSSRLFAFSFLCFSLAYFIEFFMNSLILFKITQDISVALKIFSINIINLILINFHLILFTIGLVTLAYMTLRVKSPKTYCLLLVLSLISLFLVSNPIFFYYLFSIILLIYVSLHYLLNYLAKKKISSLLMLMAFILLLIGNIPLLFSISNHETYYVIGHFLEVRAYLFILINLIMVQRHEQKARPTSNRT